MKLLMYGVNKETIMKEDTVKYFLDDEKKKTQMNMIFGFDGVEEIAVLTNGFRNEYYLYVDELTFSHGEFLRYLADETDKSLQEIILETYSKFNEDVLRHLFEVASGYLSDPKGSYTVLDSVEEALQFANHINTCGEMIGKMFQSAIFLSYDLKLNQSTQPLNQTELTHYIYLLKNEMNSLEKKNFLISGNDFDVYFLTKLLLFAGARSISIVQRNEEESLEQFEKIKPTLDEVELTKVYPITEKSLYYRLSTIDGSILDTSKVNLLSQKIQDEVSVIRQTKKLQYLIDTSEEAVDEKDYLDLDLRVVSGHTEPSYKDKELEEAMAIFEEKLDGHINEFMLFLQNKQVNNTQEPLLH